MSHFLEDGDLAIDSLQVRVVFNLFLLKNLDGNLMK